MPKAADDEFVFPDEIEAIEGADDDLEVELVDDTPPEDRGRAPLPKEIVKELDDDDLEQYSEKVKKRLSQFKKVWHDERREKERAAREREEAVEFAKRAYQENQILRQRIGTGERVFLNEVSKAAANELASAKAKLKEAYELGDSQLIADAQEAMTDAKFKLRELEQFQPSSQEQEVPVQQAPQVRAPTPVRDTKAEAWRERNEWFGTDEEMTALALGLHEKLVKDNVDPRSDEYYRTIDATMRKRFPEKFEEAKPERPQNRRPQPVVAPATRSTAPRQVRLTPSQVALAKRLGLTNEAYAREVIKLEQNNGR